ncbi:MAG TPA: YggS family pyridoxal phosphate-dependent enzyme [Bacteroidales bacterium]|nr:YggS family pyridoxal phosphate-dependent enzyme [Bacteroidales bacterium]
MGIAENITSLRKAIPQNVEIIAVSKTRPVTDLLTAYNAGQRAFGENKVQEIIQKQPLMPDDVEWHMIGHLQSNKIKYIISRIHLIHSVDSLKLLVDINREAAKINRIVDCLLQIHIASEESKFGLSFDEASSLLNSDEYKKASHIRIRGLMGMATFTDDEIQVRQEFDQLASFFKVIREKWFTTNTMFSELSMGMSGDYKLAIDAGSTMVRIGTSIFGERNYNL